MDFPFPFFAKSTVEEYYALVMVWVQDLGVGCPVLSPFERAGVFDFHSEPGAKRAGLGQSAKFKIPTLPKVGRMGHPTLRNPISRAHRSAMRIAALQTMG
jgi:hypothetical protein